MKKLFSILTPTYNRAGTFLPQTIKSIQNQKEDGFEHEHIIVDNCSTDNTEAIIKAFAKSDKRIKYIKNDRNLGPADALNVAFEHSKGDYIVPLDDDDMLPLFSLQFRYNFFKRNRKAEWTYGHSLFVRKDNSLLDDLLEYKISYKHENTDLKSLLGRCFIPNGTVTVKRAALQKTGGWEVGIKTQDYDMWLKLAANKVCLHKIDSYLCLYRVHPDQISRIHMNDGTYEEAKEYFKKKYAKPKRK